MKKSYRFHGGKQLSCWELFLNQNASWWKSGEKLRKNKKIFILRKILSYENFQIKTLIFKFGFLGEQVSYFDISWWIMTLGTWFWPKSQSLTFQCTVDFWSVDWKIHLSIQCIWDLLKLVIRSRWFHFVLETMFEPNFPLARWKKIRNCPFSVKNPNFDHFALLMIWSNFLRSCDPNLIKWYIWV